MAEILCAWCGYGFEYAGSQNKIYCSARCKKQASLARKGAEPRKVPCGVCGNVFEPRTSNGKFCSPACYQIAAAKRMRATRAKYKRRDKEKAMLRWTECICPKCGGRHKLRMYWTGTGTPRMYHPKCLETACYQRNGIELDTDIAMLGA